MYDQKLKDLEEKYFEIENKVFDLQNKLKNKELTQPEFDTLKKNLNDELTDLRNKIQTLKEKNIKDQPNFKESLIEQLIELRNNFQVDYNLELKKATKGVVYISASPYDHFRFLIDFHKFPKKPVVQFSSEAKGVLAGKPEDISPTLKNWDKDSPGRFVDIFQEIESTLIDKIGLKVDQEVPISQKLAARRKSIVLAKELEEDGELQDAIWALENALKISEELKESDKVEKFKQKIEELKHKINNN